MIILLVKEDEDDDYGFVSRRLTIEDDGFVCKGG